MMLALFFTNWFHYFYIPSSGPWYAGNVWGNLFVVVVAAPLAFIWAKTKFWPLRPIRHGIDAIHKHVVEIHSHAKHQTMLAEEMHHLAHTGTPHPRVLARVAKGQKHTPPRSRA